MQQPPILIIEDDRKTSDLLVIYLAREGFNTHAAYTGNEALDFASQRPPLLAILDVKLPDMDGWEVCRRLRRISSVPIVMLSGLRESPDKVKGLKLGADDYIAKPFSFEEVTARVRAILRRTQPHVAATVLSYGSLTLDRGARKVTLAGRAIAVTASEFRLLEALLGAPGHVFTRRELLGFLYPAGGVVVYRVVDVHIANLRQKLEDDPARPRLIGTVRGIGYCLAKPEEEHDAGALSTLAEQSSDVAVSLNSNQAQSSRSTLEKS